MTSLLTEIDLDTPLPEAYGSDRIRLMAQSPRSLYLYWEHARDPFETLSRTHFGAEAAGYSSVLKIINLQSGDETTHPANATRTQWLDADPNSAYRVEVGLVAPERPFIRLLYSNEVRTPACEAAPAADDAAAFTISGLGPARGGSETAVGSAAQHQHDFAPMMIGASDTHTPRPFSAG